MKHCWYCGTELRQRFTTKDHQVPQSRGGKTDPKNCVECCRNCNTEKADMNLEEYRIFVYFQKLGSPQFGYEQIKWLRERNFKIKLLKDDKLTWDGKFFGEHKSTVS